MEYFSQCVPWPGIRPTEHKHHAYGLLPRFELSSAGNIVAWNKIRCYLQTFEAEGFNQEQQTIFWVVLISLAMMIAKAVGLAQLSQEEHSHELTMSELVDTLMIKIIVMQIQSIIVICNLLWTGVQTTNMQEHGLRHILLLKKSGLTNYLHPLYFSTAKRVDMLVPTSFTLPQLQECIEARLGVSQTQQRIAVHGVSFHGYGSEASSKLDREQFEDRRATLIAKMDKRRQTHTDVADPDDDDKAEMEYYQAFFRRDDSVRSVHDLRRLSATLHARFESQKRLAREEQARLDWIEDILKPHPVQEEAHRHVEELHDDEETQTLNDCPMLTEPHQPRRSAPHVQSGSAAMLAMRGPSLLAVANYAKPTGNTGTLTPTKSGRDMQVTQNLVLEEEAGYAKYTVLIRDGQDIQVTSDEMRPEDKRLLDRWLKINKAVAEGPKTSSRVLIIGQETGALGSLGLSPCAGDGRLTSPISGAEQATGSVGGASRSETGSYTGSRHHDSRLEDAGLAGYPEADELKFEQWAKVDTMRHMIDSLVMIMEEERLPVAHLKTIEDTRPTIRLPFY